MPVINTVVERIVSWLAAETFDPPVREVTVASLVPAAAYPQVLVSVESESFNADGAGVRAEIKLTVSHAAGRPASALATVRSLAHQIRRSLNHSHRLGGAVLALAISEISFGRRDRTVDGGVIATAELELNLRYATDPLTD